MPIKITKITGIGGNPPTHITVDGTVTNCDEVYVKVTCTDEEVKLIKTPKGGPWSATFSNDRGCGCGESASASAACSRNMAGAVKETMLIACDPPPPVCCDRLSISIDTNPLPCIPTGGGTVSIRCSATLWPKGCTGPFEWEVSNSSTGTVIQPFTPGSSTFSYAYSAAGTYQVTVRVKQANSCSAPILTDKIKLTIIECAPCFGGAFVDECRIDLPKNDVIEAIEFERFFRLNLLFGHLQDANTTPGLIDINSLPVAIYLPFRQEWRLCGYSRGRLVNSFTLGPQEEQTIDIFKWDRMTRNMESSTSFESEETTESSSTRRDTSDVARDISRQAGFELTSQGKVGFKVGVVNADITAGNSARAGMNEAEKATRTSILDATARSTGRVRTSRTLKIVEGREYGQETRITRRLRNTNQCHTLTIAFLEILANYTVSTFVRTDDVRLVVLIDPATLGAVKVFDRTTLRSHETSLRLALLDSRLADGFAAARFLDARDRACAVLCEGCSCGESIGGRNTPEWDTLTAAAAAVGMVVNAVLGRTLFYPLSVPGLAAPVYVPAIHDPMITDVKRLLFSRSLKAYAPQLLSNLAALGLGVATTVTVTQVEGIARALAGIPSDVLAKLAYDQGITDGVQWEIRGLLFLTFPVDPVTASIAAAAATAIVMGRLGGTYDDGGLVGAITLFHAAYESWKKYVQAQIEKDENAAALQKIEKEEREMRVLEAYPLRETADAFERLDALLLHLNELPNLDHYSFAVWNERSGATDARLIGLALSGLIDPIPVGMVGDQLAVPVRMAPNSKRAQFLLDSIADLVARDDREHILPTPALYAEAIVGTCCSCESTIERTTELDLERKGLDNKLVELETERLRARLDSKSPKLDGEIEAPAIRVELTNASTKPHKG
ncbi:MAG: PKD domain-containing protein [Pyrinomonadaceae bacterium]|nr:PKD domain-containing protein [Pyrinomonadaceae bacterium]